MMRFIAPVLVSVLLPVAIVASAPALAQNDSGFNRTCYGTGNPDQTIKACSNVIAGGFAQREDLGAAFKFRGNAYDDVGDHDSAIDDYGHAIAINPRDTGVFNDRGTSYRAKGQYELSVLDYDRALTLNPENAMALSNRCFAKAVLNRFEEALMDCNESLRLRPGDPSTLASRGFAFLKLGRSQSAIADYDAEIRTNPGNPYSLFGRGVGKRLTGDLSGGNADLAAAKTIDSGIEDGMAKLGVRP
jgi:tetratricopeptide (TPR) repeat protein